MFKVIYNDIVIDLIETVKWVRCLKKSKRIVNTDKSSAHGFPAKGSWIYGRLVKQKISVKLIRLTT